MGMQDLISWRPWSRTGTEGTSLMRQEPTNPFLSLHREMNRLFDEAFRDFGLAPFGRVGMWPSVEVSDNEREVRVTAELPGMEEKDVEVLMQDRVLTIRGERKLEREDQERQFSERYYGRFERRIPVDAEVEADKATAEFKNGVLTVTLPKSAQAMERAKRIPIAKGS